MSSKLKVAYKVYKNTTLLSLYEVIIFVTLTILFSYLSSSTKRGKARLTLASAIENMLQEKSRPKNDRMLPSQQEIGEEKLPFCPTGCPDSSVYGPMSGYNGCAVLLKWSAMHGQVHKTDDLM